MIIIILQKSVLRHAYTDPLFCFTALCFNLLFFPTLPFCAVSEDEVAHINIEFAGRSEEVVAINMRAHGTAVTEGGAVTTSNTGERQYIRAVDRAYFPLQYVLLWPHGEEHGYTRDMKGAGEKVCCVSSKNDPAPTPARPLCYITPCDRTSLIGYQDDATALGQVAPSPKQALRCSRLPCE